MFAKLLNYEWRGCRQVLGVLCAITLASGLMMGLSGVYLTATEGQKSYFLAILLLFVAALAIGICAAGGFFYLIWRFYQSRFTDEGYLTFTLPVNTHQQLLSALVNIFRGTALVFLATLGAFALMGLSYVLIFFPRDVNWGEVFQAVRDHLSEFLAWINWTGCFQVLALCLMGFAALVVKLLVCVTVGAVLAKKHRLLTAVAAWFGIEMLQSWGILTLGFHNAFSDRLFADLFVDYGMLMNLLIVILGYLLMHWLMEKKLNLT